MNNSYSSWGGTFNALHDVRHPAWANELNFTNSDKKYLAYGNGRSYGDSCLNDGGILIDVRNMDHFIHFDEKSGTLTCEAGVQFEQILKLIVPQGWFLPVTPGTRYITVGGAVANDIHGKNHHVGGTFGHHVSRFELIRSNGEKILCTPQQNRDMFNATIGGLGLTGTILWVEFALKKISTPFIHAESIRFDSLGRFFDLCNESNENYEYTVAWIDSFAKGNRLGRGIFIRGNHATTAMADSLPRYVEKNVGRNAARKQSKKLSVPIETPFSFVNPISSKIFSKLYYAKHSYRPKKYYSHYIPFFYPLDRINNWNRLYGKKGFFQYQCVVPANDSKDAISEILQRIAGSAAGSFLTVLKMFGTIQSPGLLSFPQEGVTLAVDFTNKGKKTLDLLEDLDAIVRAYSGAVYPAKDARMSSKSFKHYFPQWQEFNHFVDNNYSSGFWRRVMEK